MNSVGFTNEKIKYVMKLKGISAYRLSKMTSIHKMTLHDILTGKTKYPKIDTLYKIADGLGVHIYTII